jgi:predicted DNA-binding antitoxin AbrB/MazE fold protein
MPTNTLTIEAFFEDGVFHPLKPLLLAPRQKVTLTIECQEVTRAWPEDVAAIYQEINDEDRRLAEGMFPAVRETWPISEEQP